MIRIVASIGVNTYYFSTETLDFAGRLWEPRISNTIQLTREFSSSETSGNKIRTLDISLDNRDGFFNSIYETSGLVNAKITIYYDEGDEDNITFTGRVNKINSFGDDISLNIRESGYEYLTEKVPDAQIAYDYYSANGINESWNAIPIHFGKVDKYPLAWINRFESHFIIGSGPIRAVKRVYFDNVVIYDEDEGIVGYEPTPEYGEIKVRIFKGGRIGVPEVVDGITSPYDGFAFIQLYRVIDGVETYADPIMTDGEVVQIYADIEGIENDSKTGMVRNPVEILKYLFTKPYTGEEGYGLGIDSSEIDFDEAIIDCNTEAFLIDGSIDNTVEFGEWIDEILKYCRGRLFESGGKIKIAIDKAPVESGVIFCDLGVNGYNCNIDSFNEPERDAQTNRVRLNYDWNNETDRYNKKPSYNKESTLNDYHLVDETHALRIGKWNTEDLEFKLVRDDMTAHKLGQYYLKNIVKQLITTTLETDVYVSKDLDAGDVVRVYCKKFGWVNKAFRITNITRDNFGTDIELKEYSSDIFIFIAPGTAPEEPIKPISKYDTPNKPILEGITSNVEVLLDGTIQTKIVIEYTKPEILANYIGIYFKLKEEPESAFRILDTTMNPNRYEMLWRGYEIGDYNFRLVSVSSVGIFSKLAIDVDDKHYYGQPAAETYISLRGDTEPPAKPILSNVQAIHSGAKFTIDITGGLPYDFSHYIISRKVGNGTLTAIDTRFTGSIYFDNEVIGENDELRYYSVVAVDTSGNASISSDLTIGIEPIGSDFEPYEGFIDDVNYFVDGIISGNKIGEGAVGNVNIANGAVFGVNIKESEINNMHLNNEALKNPTGEVIYFTPRNCTTESIAIEQGVKDVSGYANHGIGKGGIQVVKDDVLGDVYKLDGVDDYIDTEYKLFTGKNSSVSFSLSMWVKIDPTYNTNIMSVIFGSMNYGGVGFARIKDKEGLYATWRMTGSNGSIGPLGKDNEWFHVALVWGGSEYNKIWVYLNGELFGVRDLVIAEFGESLDNYKLRIGYPYRQGDGNPSYFKGELTYPRVFNRALTTSEVKTLYMVGTTSAQVGMITADLITTGELITRSAQIGEALINTAHIKELDAGKITTGTLDANRIGANSIGANHIAANAITAAALDVRALAYPTGEILNISANGCTTESIAEIDGVKDVSGHGNHGRAYGGVEVVDSEVGKAFKFDGSGQYIKITNILDTNIASLSAWVKRSAHASNSYRDIFSSTGSSNRHHMIFDLSWELIIWDGSKKGFGYILPDDNKYHLITIIFHSNISASAYVDGMFIKTRAIDLDITTYKIEYIGGNPSYNYPAGLIAHPKIYNRALSAPEIKTLYMFPNSDAMGQLTADRIATNAILAKHIKANEIESAHIKSNAITASKLLITSPASALNNDPNFEDLTNWNVMDGYSSDNNWNIATVTDGKSGTKVMRGGGIGKTAPFVQIPFIPIDTAKLYRVTVWARKRSSNTNGSIYISIREYNHNQVNLSSNMGTYVLSAITPTTTWTQYTTTIGQDGTHTFNASTKYIRIGGLLDWQVTVGSGYEIQGLRIEEIIPNTLIKDGAITTDKIASNSIESVHIKANAITTDKIYGKQLNSDNYQAPLSSEKFAQQGSSYNLNNATITTEYLYSNDSGAGIKGHIEADSGRFGIWDITESGSIEADVEVLNTHQVGDIIPAIEIRSSYSSETSNVNLQVSQSFGMVRGEIKAPLIDTPLGDAIYPEIYLKNNIQYDTGSMLRWIGELNITPHQIYLSSYRNLLLGGESKAEVKLTSNSIEFKDDDSMFEQLKLNFDWSQIPQQFSRRLDISRTVRLTGLRFGYFSQRLSNGKIKMMSSGFQDPMYDADAVDISTTYRAFIFNGSSSVITTPTPVSSLESIIPRSFSIAFSLDSDGYTGTTQTIMATCKTGAPGKKGFFIARYSNPQTLYVGICDGTTLYQWNTGIPAGTHYLMHCVFIRDMNTIKFYANNELVVEGTIPTLDLFNSEGVMKVGQDIDGNYKFKGEIGDILIYDRVLTEEEIKIHTARYAHWNWGDGEVHADKVYSNGSEVLIPNEQRIDSFSRPSGFLQRSMNYIKLNNGTLIHYGSFYSTAPYNTLYLITFETPFFSPYYSCSFISGRPNAGSGHSIVLRNKSTTSVVAEIIPPSNSSNSHFYFDYICIGRWK